MIPAKKTIVEKTFDYSNNYYKSALDHYKNSVENLVDAMHNLEQARSRRTVYRLMNDIRTGKIIPVVAETGEIANVTFS